MRPAQEIQVRSKRRQSWFSVDNELIDEYGERIGAHGIAVYVALCRYVNDDTQKSSVGLTKLAGKLKMGRAKLIETLKLLEREGLIEITAGDRTHTSIYTLLEIKKGSAGENQLEEVGGSNQNQGSSSQNQVGGSNQNCIKTTEYKTTSKKEERTPPTAELHYLNNETRKIVHTLMSMEKWDKNEAQTLEMVSVSKAAFPQVDLSHVATSLSYKIRTGVVQIKKPSRAFPKWVSYAAERVMASPPERPRIRAEER